MTDTWVSQSSIHAGFGGSAPSAGGGEGEIAAPPADRGLRREQQLRTTHRLMLQTITLPVKRLETGIDKSPICSRYLLSEGAES